MKLILLGAPGAGKGSQAAKITAAYGLAHISTGDILRANIAAGTELGSYAKTFMNQGLLVPDEVIIQMIDKRIKEKDCEKGFVLDGFPRTLAQAEALDKLTEIDKVINLEVDFGLVLKRITGRRMCPCGETYHVSTYDKDVCKVCGKPLYQRDDDKPETVSNRLEVYRKQTAPLIEYYEKKGILVNVDSNVTIDQTFELVKEILG